MSIMQLGDTTGSDFSDMEQDCVRYRADLSPCLDVYHQLYSEGPAHTHRRMLALHWEFLSRLRTDEANVSLPIRFASSALHS